MKTTIVCGLLGSGKTTFIRGLLAGNAEKSVVLVNDFGSAGIDGEILYADGIEFIELASGCVCCSLQEDLIASVETITRKFCPEHLIIEPSGVAAASGVLEALESARIAPAAVVGIVDVTEFAELYESDIYGSFFHDQVEVSDIILVNKIDLADECKIKKAEQLIASINAHALVFRTINAELRCHAFAPARLPIPKHKLRGKSPHFHFETLSFRIDRDAGYYDFSAFFHDLAQGRYGTVVRAKALIQADTGAYRFDGVFGKVNIAPFKKNIEYSRLVVIGMGLDVRGITAGMRTKNTAS